MPSTNYNWLDGRLDHTLRRGREWLAPNTKPSIQELKDKATVAVADVLAAQAPTVHLPGQDQKAPVVRLPNGDYIWGNPYQATNPEWKVPPEIIERQKQMQLQMQQQQYESAKKRGLIGVVGGLFGH